MRKRDMVVYFLEVLFLVIPTISRQICLSFRCKAFEEGETYLSADMSISCNSERYRAMTSFATIMMLVYPFGVPLLLFVMLAKFRKRFNPPLSRDEAEAVRIREADKDLQNEPIASFAVLFRPRFWVSHAYQDPVPSLPPSADANAATDPVPLSFGSPRPPSLHPLSAAVVRVLQPFATPRAHDRRTDLQQLGRQYSVRGVRQYHYVGHRTRVFFVFGSDAQEFRVCNALAGD